ncbi:MAG: energy transducer TonB [Muribaculaceae bacterium]|nr:energy transducer TonB [Muribaculaceae bacterium]
MINFSHLFRFTHIPRHLPLTALIALSSLAYAIPAQAQTCRMRVSVNSGGGDIIYREVYEYDYVWEKPSFPGGDDKLMCFINKHRKYPKKAYKAGIQGRVMCSFIVNTDGGVSDVQVYKGVEQSLNEEAVRIFSIMPKWNPGRMNGVPVPVRVIRTVPFRR